VPAASHASEIDRARNAEGNEIANDRPVNERERAEQFSMATMKQRDSLSSLCFACACLALTAVFGGESTAQNPDGFLEVQCEGGLGTTRAGMTIEVKQGSITGGHYFVAGDLLDILITGGGVHDGHIAISTADGSTFELRFKSNGSEHGEPLDFKNSVGLVGTRHNGGRVEKVDLGFLTMGPPSEGRRYAFTTGLSDSKFESIVRSWRTAVLTGNRKEAAKYTHFPLRVNANHRHKRIRTPAELSEQWDRIFTPAYLSQIKKDLPHDMLGENSSLLVMLGSGDVWFGDKGIEVLNLPD
jgi:hypothetical protein